MTDEQVANLHTETLRAIRRAAFMRGYEAGWRDATDRIKEQVAGMDIKPRPGAAAVREDA